MYDSDRKHNYNNCFGIVMRILLTVVLLTIAVMFVWARSNQIKDPSSVHHTSGDETVELDQGLTTPISIQELAGEQTLIQLHVTSRSRNDSAGAVIQDNQFRTGPSISKNRAPMFVKQGKLIKKMPHSIYNRRGNTSTVVDENNESDTFQVLHKMDIRLSHSQKNNHGHNTIQIEKTVADTKAINNNQNAYDLTYNVNEKGSEENKYSIDRSSRTTFFNRSENIIPGRLVLLETLKIINGSSDHPPFRLKSHNQNKKDMQHMFKQYDANRNPNIPEGQLLKHIAPLYEIDFRTHPTLRTRQDSSILQPPEGISVVQNNTSSSSQSTVKEVPLIYEILWRRIGLIALIKLGLVKLKVIGFIKILYLLLFKLKFVLIVLFLKFFSLLKFIKFSSLPLFVLPLAAIIFLMTTKTFLAYTPLTLDTNNNPGMSSTIDIPIPNNMRVANPLGGTIKFTDEILTIPGETVVVPSGETQIIPNHNIPPDVVDAFINLGLRYEPLEVMDPTLDLFQMELNSEKCVERIACKIAVTGKTGIVPLWINWVLHRVSNPVPNDKLLNFLKAYDDVINEIQMKSPNPDNWETWCIERYDCNNTDTK